MTQASRSDITNAIRALSMDAVQKANSGHPGAPMGMAEIAEVLWRHHLKHNPKNPHWADRDRFVLSNGHGSMLIYSLLHLTGYDLSMDDIKSFRQLHSKTPGHPEVGVTPGIETTTGPLGQGLANAVGMAIAERELARTFNRPGMEIVGHHTYVFAGDGCMMEGISHEVCSLAGTLGLGKLIVFYDDNGISIDGKVEGWFRDNTPMRFASYGWNVIPNVDGHDPAQINAAILEAKEQSAKPTLICCKTVIGKGSPNLAGTDKVHGAALGDKEVAATREAIGWRHAPFAIPQDIYDAWDATHKGAALEAQWSGVFTAYEHAEPALAAEFKRRMRGDLPTNFTAAGNALMAKSVEKAETVATRKASQFAIEAFAQTMPEMIGGSADLTGSVFTNWSGSKALSVDYGGNYINFGVREFGMAAIANGMTLHGGFAPYHGTFLTFSDYSRNALRMAALMKIRNICVFTHDSIGLGEDGPTHQSVEHVASLRLIPNMDLWRPCDTVEAAAAWRHALARHNGPTCLIFSRQNSPFQRRDADALANVARGGYVLSKEGGTAGKPAAVIIATGTEVSLAIEAQKLLAAENIHVRVVSMPSTFEFDQQSTDYRESVLPKGVRRVAVEAGVTDYWRKYVGLDGAVVGIDTFGESAPAGVLYKHFGITAEQVVSVVVKG
ncbi:MAG: transketolase [Rhodocyclaceae bacterium]|nr:transketolase [Rhodocyclaceae bacterium]MCA3031085.1 transketolase [Rhodocyclaceae bacterium]MCA3036320.1 transketolase [Rhodocyclaceae bacterium]MCA3039307.1 transketolase [Rhodocyclaceae bacterium]MCA3045842.1 transketolase [Rhodocyclaceae bacterium]